MIAVRKLMLQGMRLTGTEGLLTPLMRQRGTIFMLHRFRDLETGVEGHDPEGLRRVLAYLRRENYPLVSVEAMHRALLGEGELPTRAVAFTIDDGYYDHARFAAPVFAEFDCPVTTFVTTGFLDGELWFWWDRIEYVFGETRRSALEVEIGGEQAAYSLEGAGARDAAGADFTRRCKWVPESEKQAAIERLAVAAAVELPARAPARYAPMTWDELRSREEKGMSFGPHTVTHPILGRVSDEQAREEIAGSWARLREEAARPSPVFCYPNGQPEDYGPREFSILTDAGLLGAVVGTPGAVERERVQEDPNGRFVTPRYNYPETVDGVLQYVSGLERAKDLVLNRGVGR